MHQEHEIHDNLPPPPAYSEQEFDQKISRATDLSLQSVNSVNQQIDEDGWETYDEAAFEAISHKLASMELRHDYGQSSSGSSSSQIPTHVTSGTHAKRKSTEKVPLSGAGLAPINPLRIEKKGAPGYGQSFEGQGSIGQGGGGKAIRSEPEPPPAFTAEPGPDESELNWSRPSSASSSALSPIDSQLFPSTQHSSLLSHDVSQQSSHRIPELAHQPTHQTIPSQGNPQTNPQPHVQPQADAQQYTDPYGIPSPTHQYTAPIPSNTTGQPSYQQTHPRPLPPTNHNVQPGYQQPSLLSNPEPSYHNPSTQSTYQPPSPSHNLGQQPGYTSFSNPTGSPRIQPRFNASPPPQGYLHSQQAYRNSVSLNPPSLREMRHQSVAYPSSSDPNIATPQPTRQSLPMPPRQQPTLPTPPVHNMSMGYVKPEALPTSRLPFNNSMAYGNTFSQHSARPVSTMFNQRPEPARGAVSNIQYNPRELYNTAVSSHLTTFSSRPSASPNMISTSIGGTTPQQPTTGLTHDTYNPYSSSSQSIQGNPAPQNTTTFSHRTSTYWPNTTGPNFQPQYNNQQNAWSGQSAAMNVGAPLVAQSHNPPQWYSYPSG